MTMKKYLLHLLTVAAVLSLALSCGHQQQAAQKQTEADSIIQAAISAKDYERVITLCDSFQQTGDISKIRAAYNRGLANDRLGKTKLAMEDIKKALAETPKNEADSLWFYQCACYLASLYNVTLNYETLLQLALPMIEELKAWAEKKPTDQIFECLQRLTVFVGHTQLRLGMKKEAEKMYELSIRYMDKQKSTSHSLIDISNNAIGINNIILSFIDEKDYITAERFLPRLDSLASEMTTIQDSTAAPYIDKVLSMDYYLHASIENGLNRPKEADHYFALYQNTQHAKTIIGRANKGDLLLKMKRYDEAADAYAVLDHLFAAYNMELSLDNMIGFCDKFKANYMAGRRDTALAVAAYVFENLDSVITKQKNSDAAELATVYETQQKDAEIAQQQIELNAQRWIATVITLILVIIIFVVYTLVRRRAAKRLAEMKAAQERIESELRIARDIQMSMVPHEFPHYEGLDLYASMAPAKEVGGDLYGYVINGNNLYFAVGDVSGKGVPASLFMAQATRLFRTMANEGMLPADICNRMNRELSGDDNVSGMFVTMFIGMLDLQTGHLNFCNAGHNPPVIGGGEHHGDFLEIIPNAPIGLWPDFDYEGEEIDTIKGRALFIYTDGLNEAEDLKQKQFGDDRLIGILRDTHFYTSQQVIDTLASEVEKHRNGAEPNDDLTMMCLKVI